MKKWGEQNAKNWNYRIVSFQFFCRCCALDSTNEKTQFSCACCNRKHTSQEKWIGQYYCFASRLNFRLYTTVCCHTPTYCNGLILWIIVIIKTLLYPAYKLLLVAFVFEIIRRKNNYILMVQLTMNVPSNALIICLVPQSLFTYRFASTQRQRHTKPISEWRKSVLIGNNRYAWCLISIWYLMYYGFSRLTIDWMPFFMALNSVFCFKIWTKHTVPFLSIWFAVCTRN